MNAPNSVIGYCKFKKLEKRGFLKYGAFKRIIAYILDYYNDYFVRKIFLELVEMNYFVRKKNIKQSYLYKFNPNPSITPKETVDESYFTVSWD